MIKILKNGFKKQKARGFTLIELLVAVTISGIILTAVMTSYASFSTQKFQIDLQRTLQAQGSTAISRITDKVRDRGIDLSAVKGENAIPVNGGQKFIIENEGLWVEQNGEKQRMISEDFVVEGTAEITPKSAEQRLFQPKVHLKLKITHPLQKNVGLEVQTVISSRLY